MIIVYTPEAQKQLSKLDKKAAGQIKSYMERIAALEDPRDKGKALKGNLGEYWRYRTGDYRIICKIQDFKLLVTVLRIGNRKEVYRR